MPRLCYAGALLGIATLLPAPISAQKSAPASAQNSSAKSASDRARVQRVVVRGTGAAMEIEIQTSGALVAPDTQAITGPDRIVVDFPGLLPAAELRALKVNRGALKGIRTGLFFDNPPITRVVLDLAEPQSYRILTTKVSTTQNTFVVTLAPVKLGSATAAGAKTTDVAAAPAAKLRSASLAAVSNPTTAPIPDAVTAAPPPPQPLVTVTFGSGMLRIHAERATLAQVLYEVQRQTQAEIAIPAGAEQEQVVADLGPAPAREVLASLLNGSSYNFIFVGNENNLERVILTRRDPNTF